MATDIIPPQKFGRNFYDVLHSAHNLRQEHQMTSSFSLRNPDHQDPEL